MALARSLAPTSPQPDAAHQVLAAHLRPIHAPGGARKPDMLPAWAADPEGNQLLLLRGGGAGQQPAAPLHEQPAGAPQQQQWEPPRTAADFARAWRLAGSAGARFAYLRAAVAPARLPALLRVEVGGALLGEAVGALAAGWRQHQEEEEQVEQQQQQPPPPQQQQQQPPGEEGAEAAGANSSTATAAFVLETLQAFAECGRFALAARLLARADRAALAALLDSVAAAAAAPGVAGVATLAHFSSSGSSGGCGVSEAIERLRRAYLLETD